MQFHTVLFRHAAGFERDGRRGRGAEREREKERDQDQTELDGQTASQSKK